MGKLSKLYKIDRKAQNKGWFSEFFDTKVMKMIGLLMTFTGFLLIIFTVCVVTNHTYFAGMVWDLCVTLIKLISGGALSAAGIKAEHAL